MLTKFLCKRPTGCQCLLVRPARRAITNVCHSSKQNYMCPKKRDSMQTNYSMQQIAYFQRKKKKKYNPLFSSPPRSRCLIQHINTKKSNYSCRMKETQLQHSTALAPSGGCGVAALCHVPAGSAPGPPCCSGDPARGAAPRPPHSAPEHPGPQRRGDGCAELEGYIMFLTTFLH